MIPLSLYIHIPWCEKKCPYCDFNSHEAKAEVDEMAYVRALLTDLRADLANFGTTADKSPVGACAQDRKLVSIFIGGGTPSLFCAASIAAILEGVADQIELAEDIEITLEANPGSAEAGKFVGFRQAGVNRLSIGVQSFNPEHLNQLGRVHTDIEAIDAAGYAVKAGFDGVNLDLMFGLPTQSVEQCLLDVRQAIDLKPTHLSCYQLTIEPNTLFHHHPPITPNDEMLWEMQLGIHACLASSNFQQYEVSAYSLADYQCRHNLNYWQFGDYLGIGAGAHGKITNSKGQVFRNWKIKHPELYRTKALNGEVVTGITKQVAKNDLPFEFMLNALRLTGGFELDLFAQRTSQQIRSIDTQINRHQEQGLICINEQRLCPTDRGSAMINTMLQDYLNGG